MSSTLPRHSTVPKATLKGNPPEELHSGDRMTREEFHCIYLQTPEHLKAELIGGTVYVASPVSRRHGGLHSLLNFALVLYRGRTPGIEVLDNATVFLDEEGEPQPDLLMRVLTEYAGQSRTTSQGDYVVGAPEFILEIAYSSRSVDLHVKRDDYARCGVKEYVIWSVKDECFVWFDLAKGVESTLPTDGVLRSFAFPGLWLDSEAVRADDLPRLTTTVEAGLATPEHAAFVRKLAESKR